MLRHRITLLQALCAAWRQLPSFQRDESELKESTTLLLTLTTVRTVATTFPQRADLATRVTTLPLATLSGASAAAGLLLSACLAAKGEGMGEGKGERENEGEGHGEGEGECACDVARQLAVVAALMSEWTAHMDCDGETAPLHKEVRRLGCLPHVRPSIIFPPYVSTVV